MRGDVFANATAQGDGLERLLNSATVQEVGGRMALFVIASVGENPGGMPR